MSRELIKKRQKAVRLAWEREKRLVKAGKGTRDWTREQQEDILNPDIGKAQDEFGYAFEGQHMKSVNGYEAYSDNPDNIQFLTKQEHLEAHKGCWQNITNWYYDPITKEFLYFKEDELIPCKIIELSDPVVPVIKTENKTIPKKEKKDEGNKSPPRNNNRERISITADDLNNYKKKKKSGKDILKSMVKDDIVKKPRGLLNRGKELVKKHPVETIEAITLLGTAALELKMGKPLRNKAGVSVTSSFTNLDSGIVKNSIKSDSACHVGNAGKKAAHDIVEHLMRLPAGKKASPAKLAEAKALGIIVPPGYTFVKRSRTKGYN